MRTTGLLLLCLGCTTAPTRRPPSVPVSSTATAHDSAGTLSTNRVEQAEASARAPAPEQPPQTRRELPPPDDKIMAVLARPNIGWFGAPRHIVLMRRGVLRFAPQGPVVATGIAATEPWDRRFEVVDAGESARIVTDQGGVRLVVYVELGDAHPAITREVVLREQPEEPLQPAPRRGYVRLHPGALVELTERREDMVHVTHSVDRAFAGGTGTSVSGWVPAASLGAVVSVGGVASDGDDGESDSRSHVTARPTVLRQAPSGPRLVTLESGAFLVEQGPRVRGRQRFVSYQPPCVDDVSFTGFVDVAALKPLAGGLGLCGVGFLGAGMGAKEWGDTADAGRRQLSVGQFLLDPQSGAVIGCVREPAEAADLGHGLVALPTSWGPVVVELAPTGVSGQCAR